MNKRGITLLLMVFLFSLSAMTACSAQNTSQDKIVYTEQADAIMGLTLKLPEKELSDWTVLYGPFDQSIDRGKYAPVDGSYLSFMPMESGITLFSIQYYEESKWDSWLKEGHTADEITGIANSEEIGREDGAVYIYTQPTPDETGMAMEVKEKYQSILKILPTIRKSITITIRGASNTGEFPSFSTTDLEGNPVANTAFSDYEITMVNIWGTFCGPCIEEMTDLESLSKKMPEGTHLVGLVSDALDDEHKTLAKKILSEKGVTYENWITDDALTDYVNNHVTGVPTTLFIDSNGQIVGDAIIGAVGIDEYLSALTTRLNSTDSKSQSTDSGLSQEDQRSENTEQDSPQNKVDLSKNVSFTAKTPFGDAIDSSIFADYELTMINIWGTLCKPCIEEMPDIQKLYEDMQSDNISIIGFIANFQDDRVEKSKEILTKLNITYSNVVFDDEVSGSITSQIPGYPTTVFVDSKGNTVGEQVTGAHSYEEYKAIIKKRLEECTS